jgi:hypothetical protein
LRVHVKGIFDSLKADLSGRKEILQKIFVDFEFLSGSAIRTREFAGLRLVATLCM